MVSGNTTTGSLADSLDSVRSAARVVREQKGGMQQLCRRETLGVGIGLSWQEVKINQLTAQRVTEDTVLDNPQQYADSLLTITPTIIGIHTFVTDRVKNRINKMALAKMGEGAQNSIERLKDQDGLTVLATGATPASPGAGNTLTSGHIAAAKVNISSNTTEPGNPPYRCVLHGFQIKDLFDELVAGVGTYAIPDGVTATVFKTGFTLPIASCEVYENGNITIDSSTDATGGVFSTEGIIYVQGAAPRVTSERKENIGGGGEMIYHYDEYAYGLGNSTTWVQTIVSDATAPSA